MPVFRILVALLFSLILTIPSYRELKIEFPIDLEIGQMILVGFFGRDSRLPEMAKTLKDIRRGLIGSVILFDYNVVSPSQVSRLNRELQKLPPFFPLFISVDEEGGTVTKLTERKGFRAQKSLSALEISSNMTPDESRLVYLETATILKKNGFNLNFAPVVDVHNENCPVIGKYARAYSEDPLLLTLYAKACISAHREKGVLTAIKHFPGHGNSSLDSHFDFVDITDVWNSNELIPFQKLLSENMVDMVMSAHTYDANFDESHPASLSSNTIQKILREELGYDGVVITDDLGMKAVSAHYSLEEIVVLAINSGSDILLFGKGFRVIEGQIVWIPDEVVRIVKQAIRDGKIEKRRIHESYERIIRLKKARLKRDL